MDKADSIIIVEGRADVVNLVKHGYRNVIAIEGISQGIPQTVIDISKRKNVTAFVDGDKGGELVLRDLLKVAHIDYVARAPPGKEVEQLTAKEIARALRNKMTVEEYLAQQQAKSQEQPQTQQQAQPQAPQPQPAGRPPEVPDFIKAKIDEMLGTLEAEIYDEKWSPIKRLAVRELPDFLSSSEGSAYAILMDGIATQRIVDLATKRGVKYIIAARVGPVAKAPDDMSIMSFDEVKTA